MLCAVGSFAYAKEKGYEFFVDWTDIGYSDNGENAFEVIFERPKIQNNIKEGFSIYPEVWNGNMDMDVDRLMFKYGDDNLDNVKRVMRKYSVEFYDEPQWADVYIRVSYSDDLHKINRKKYGFAKSLFFGEKKYQKLIKEIFFENFEIRRDIIDLVEKFCEEKFTGHAVGVHVRYSDMMLPYEKYINIIKKAKNADTIFLATDNSDIISFFRETFGEKVKFVDKWLPDPGVPLHRNRLNVSRSENLKNAFCDLMILSRCNSLLIDSRSSFGMMAKIISMADENNIIDVAPIKHKLKRNLKRMFF